MALCVTQTPFICKTIQRKKRSQIKRWNSILNFSTSILCSCSAAVVLFHEKLYNLYKLEGVQIKVNFWHMIPSFFLVEAHFPEKLFFFFSFLYFDSIHSFQYGSNLILYIIPSPQPTKWYIAKLMKLYRRKSNRIYGFATWAAFCSCGNVRTMGITA